MKAEEGFFGFQEFEDRFESLLGFWKGKAETELFDEDLSVGIESGLENLIEFIVEFFGKYDETFGF